MPKVINGTAKTSARALVIDLPGVEGSPFGVPKRQNWSTSDDLTNRVRRILDRDVAVKVGEGKPMPWYGRSDYRVHVVRELTRGNWSIKVVEGK